MVVKEETKVHKLKRKYVSHSEMKKKKKNSYISDFLIVSSFESCATGHVVHSHYISLFKVQFTERSHTSTPYRKPPYEKRLSLSLFFLLRMGGGLDSCKLLFVTGRGDRRDFSAET